METLPIKEFVMILALLYNGDRLIAAARACDQRPFGNRFWTEMYPTALDYRPGWETAYVEVRDPLLANRLLRLCVDDRDRAGLQNRIDAITLNAGRIPRPQAA